MRLRSKYLRKFRRLKCNSRFKARTRKRKKETITCLKMRFRYSNSNSQNRKHRLKNSSQNIKKNHRNHRAQMTMMISPINCSTTETIKHKINLNQKHSSQNHNLQTKRISNHSSSPRTMSSNNSNRKSWIKLRLKNRRKLNNSSKGSRKSSKERKQRKRRGRQSRIG